MALPRKLECFGIIRKNWNDTEKISMAPAQYALPSKPLGVSDLDDTQKSRMYHFLGLLHMESNPVWVYFTWNRTLDMDIITFWVTSHGIEPIPWESNPGYNIPLLLYFGD